MKFTLSICAGLLLAGTTAFAQTGDSMEVTPHSFKSKNGHEVLPQKRDWALGISASGFLGYMGNLMNNSTFNSAPSINSANVPSAFALGNIGGMAVSGKYMRSATLAYRARLQANAGRTTYRNKVLKSLPTPDPLNPIFVEDNENIDAHVVLLSLGFEKRRGGSRLQGFYGAEAILGISGNKRTYTYGNDFTIDFTAPVSTTNFSSGISAASATRTKETFSGTTMLAGARGFGGVEYFFAPKISLGAEIGYTLGFSTNNKGYGISEQWNSAGSNKATIKYDDYPNVGLRSFGAGFDNINAGINLHFYF